jgi:hypothetical protein
VKYTIVLFLLRLVFVKVAILECYLLIFPRIIGLGTLSKKLILDMGTFTQVSQSCIEVKLYCYLQVLMRWPMRSKVKLCSQLALLLIASCW